MSRLVRKNVIMDGEAMRRAIVRIAHEIIEKNKGVENVILVGIRTRGVPLAQRIAKEIENIENVTVPVGFLDITLYRDDLSTLAYNPIVHGTELDFNISGKVIILVDDVEKDYYPLASKADGFDDVFVGRIRRDESQPNTINMWIVADNLRKGAATNTIQIAEYLVANKLV